RDVLDDKTMEPIQVLIAKIDQQVGDLDRTVGEGLAANQAPAKVFRQVTAATATATRVVGSAIDRLHVSPPSRETSPLLTQFHDLRSDINDAERVLNGIRQANTPEALAAVRTQFDAIIARVQSSIAKLSQAPEFASEAAALTPALQDIATYST